MKFLKKVMLVFSAVLLLAIAISAYIIAENYSVTSAHYDIYSNKNKRDFNDFKIAVITDFHNSTNYNMIKKNIQKEKPNIIVIVGDTINMHDESFENAKSLIKGINHLAPTYLTSGNHEIVSIKTKEFLEFAEQNNVSVINDKIEKIFYKNSYFNLIGYGDIVYDDPNMRFNVLEDDLKKLHDKVEDKEAFNVLLFHRGNFGDVVAKYPFDLIISGHIHGGQINLPYVKDYILKNRFDSIKFCKGFYRIGDSQLVISGGLERNLQKPRVFNPPEIVYVRLKSLK
ncbi:MAG: metallophosphoesterase [Firmicutes bacterium]|nr:metallophosphoesterase [Bacillota bacterium]